MAVLQVVAQLAHHQAVNNIVEPVKHQVSQQVVQVLLALARYCR